MCIAGDLATCTPGREYRCSIDLVRHRFAGSDPLAREAAAVVASRYFGEPGRAMDLIAVTGTDGKTSVSYMTESVLRLAEQVRVGVIGTAGSRIGDEVIPMPPSVLSTPELPDLQYLLGQHARPGVNWYRRPGGHLDGAADASPGPGMFVDIGVFTNLTQDHLDDRGTMDELSAPPNCVSSRACADAPWSTPTTRWVPGSWKFYARRARRPRTRWTATRTTARATSRWTLSGSRFTLHDEGRKYSGGDSVAGPVLDLQCAGHGGGAATSWAMVWPGWSRTHWSGCRRFPAASSASMIPGGASVIVDYAHSPDSL
ncbi:UDP-N-acetylmuramoyl-L-alanyl-D-glutamate--2,6-diaminopimelate ligase [Streptomyces californicus]